MNSESWFKTYRKILDWEWFKDSKTVHVFITLIALANTRDYSFKGYAVKSGQLVSSYDSLAKTTGMSVRSVRTAIEHLKQTGEVTVSPYNKFSIITVNNYSKYQSSLYDAKAREKSKKPQKSTSKVTSKVTSNGEPEKPDSMRVSADGEHLFDKQSDKQADRQATSNRQTTDNNIRIIDNKNYRKEIKGAPAAQEKVKGTEQPAGPSEGYLPQYWEREIPKAFWGRFAVEDDYWEWAQAHSEEVSQAWGMS